MNITAVSANEAHDYFLKRRWSWIRKKYIFFHTLIYFEGGLNVKSLSDGDKERHFKISENIEKMS